MTAILSTGGMRGTDVALGTFAAVCRGGTVLSMAMVKIYKVGIYNVDNDEVQISRRMATRDGARIMGGQVIEDTEREVDESELEFGEQWTSKSFRFASPTQGRMR